ncbi:putative late blight resistance protein homolog R1B-12 isoform X2 [Salvia hispanica]|uniref:putative late blight resistance protein homolog R1B-12 isoform X2 n=1 Tax=Salvia hispanica TaxID=49212 RepID=UPI00200948BF|nr:putative late blight resistance protein homolog R1B-12 isoform X2 [Salvia hispanica]
MTAYGATSSLMNTINNILCCSRFSLDDDCSQQIIQIVRRELEPWQQYILERLDKTRPSRSRKKVNALDGRIKDAIWKFEDSLESLLTQQIPSQLEILPEIVSIDLQSLQHEALSLIETLEDMKREYIYEVENMPQDKPISSSIGFPGTNSKMIGFSDLFQQLKTTLLGDRNRFRFRWLNGMAGVGKTTLAMQIYNDQEIHSKFECRAWVTVGRVPQPFSQILQGILAQLCGITQGDQWINYRLKERLRGKNCLIVLDDVWDKEALNRMYYFKDIPNGCIHVLLTGRHRKLKNDYGCDYGDEVRFLNEDESMELLCEKVFGDEICPPQLHKVAVKIAKHCEGLPLLIVTVASILSISKQNRDLAYWNDVAERRNSVFTDAYNKISEGSYWNIKDHHFPSLRFLLIEESDLVQMRSRYGSFPELRHISMNHCYKFKNIRIPHLFDHGTLEIEFEDCNPLALTWAMEVQIGYWHTLRVTSTSSFDEKPTTIKFERYGYGRFVSINPATEESNVEEITNRGEDDEDEKNDDDYTDDHEEENDDEYAYNHKGTGRIANVKERLSWAVYLVQLYTETQSSIPKLIHATGF